MRDEWADPAAGELALAARRAREEVKRRALLSAGAVLVPLPGLDVAVDVGVLVSMMNAVNRAFCLSPDQIERLGMEERVAVYEALSGVGAVMAGKSVTGVAALTIAKQLGSRWCAGKMVRGKDRPLGADCRTGCCGGSLLRPRQVARRAARP